MFSGGIERDRGVKWVNANMDCEICLYHRLRDRSSHQRCSVRKVVLRNFLKFTGKHLCQSLFFNKVKPCNFIKKETLAQHKGTGVFLQIL